MDEQATQTGEKFILELDHFQGLINGLKDRGYSLAGPTCRDGAVVYEEINAISDFPIGWTDEQDAGEYRLKKRDDDALFGYVVSPHSWKKFLHPASAVLWEAKRKGSGFQVIEGNGELPKYAFLGVRPCELRAIEIQDEIFMNGDYENHAYRLLRENLFIVVVNCVEPGGTCFCHSMQTGPKAAGGFDLALTEVLEEDRHYFLVDAGSELGAEFFRDIPHKTAGEEEVQTAENLLTKAAAKMGRSLDTEGLKELLYDNYEHLQWDDIAERCLTCGNCTMLCPTCFCNTVEDFTDLMGQTVQRLRKWDSCFTVNFTYIHGGNTRPSAWSRYRQRLMHKLATWQDQFGTIGCVGCGRCITWCPVGMDLTEEIRAIKGVPPVCRTCVPSIEKVVGTMKRILSEHPFIKDLGDEYLGVIAPYATIVRFNPGEFIFHAGENADRFYLIRHGTVAVETVIPERGAVIIQTIGEGDLLGWSCFVPPNEFKFDAQAIELTRAIAVEARCLRDRIETDPNLGYLIEKYLSRVIGQRMEATRMQLLDIYGDHG